MKDAEIAASFRATRTPTARAWSPERAREIIRLVDRSFGLHVRQGHAKLRGQRLFRSPAHDGQHLYGAGRPFFSVCFWSVDWVSVHGGPFSDLENYIEGFYFGRYQYEQAASLLEWYTQEYLWRGLVYQLGNFLDFEGIFSAIALFTLCVAAVFVALRARSVVYLLVLLNPLTVDLAFSQSRSAAAMSIIWLAMLVPSKLARLILLLLAPFFHSAMLIYSAALLIPWNVEFVRRRSGLIAAVVIIGAAAVLGPLRGGILEALGDRRAYNEIVGSGVLFTAMLASYGLPFAFARRMIARDPAAFLAVLSATLSLAVNLSAGSGNRFVALALPAFAVGTSHIPNRVVRTVALWWFLISSFIYYSLFWAA